MLENYLQSIDNLIQVIRTRVLATPDPNIRLEEFQNVSKGVLEKGYQLWDMGLIGLTNIFQSERSYIVFRLWTVLLATILLTLFAFFLGLSLTYTGIKRLLQLTQATDRFTNGDLSVRVPDPYQDEIGRQAQAFNRMAQKLEGLIHHLYELLDATKALARGNLTARIQIRQHDPEFDQVTLSFNKMAETFETIIGRLKQIALMLTTSASEIASASKEQETIVTDQESTTREIAIAANEISSTAKEFAHTMNEISRAVEHTSELALKGKGSLNNMESIMRNLVDASTKIAARLAVLNEKAGNITSVITTITRVADQTNLLSLNASIEAEKAGEYGRSFAVIAREIRRLADQTATATLDIERIVNEIMTAVSSSVMGVDEFTREIRGGVEQVRTVSEQLATIIEQVQTFTARFELVNQGMQAQSTGAEQINEAITQLSQTAQQTSEAIHQFRRTVQELNQAANELSILNPFQNSIAEKPISVDSKTEVSSYPTISKESEQQFHQTISNLNMAANKLKNLNTQLRPSQSQEDDDMPPEKTS
jgi:methyl-accepting chemotaxis protein